MKWGSALKEHHVFKCTQPVEETGEMRDEQKERGIEREREGGGTGFKWSSRVLMSGM